MTEKGIRLCRPSEAVPEILPNPDIGDFTKEDGEAVRRGWMRLRRCPPFQIAEDEPDDGG